MRQRVAACLAAVLLLAGCGNAGGNSSSFEPAFVGGSTWRAGVYSNELQFLQPADTATIAIMETSAGTIRFVLFPQQAPLAVENFCTLAQQGYYNGTAFHRILDNFVVQGGDATGTGRSGHSIWGQAFSTERSEVLHHYSGALCMAPANGKPDTHLSQFYIVVTPQDSLDEAALEKLQAAGLRQEVVDAYRQAGGAPYLDNTDTVFGQVIDGMDVADKIADTPLDDEGNPKRTVTVESVTILNWPPVPAERPQVTSTPAPTDGGEAPVDLGGEEGGTGG